MGLEAFITMVKDMKSKLPIFKYVDDSTLSHILDRNKENTLLKQALDDILVWTKRNGMCMNPTKTKDMIISGTKEANIPKLTVGDQELERVTSSKLVGLHIQNDLKWDTHVNYIVDSSKKKLFFLAQLKRAKVAEKDLVLFYKSIVRSKLEYAAPAFSTSLPQNLKDKLYKSCTKASHEHHIPKFNIQRSDEICKNKHFK